jgi:hypothetical protein
LIAVAAGGLLLAGCAGHKTDLLADRGAVTGCATVDGCAVKDPGKREHYDESAHRYFYYDAAAGRYYWEDGAPRN